MCMGQKSRRGLAGGSDSISHRVAFKMSDKIIGIKKPSQASSSGVLELVHIAYEYKRRVLNFQEFKYSHY